METTLTAMTIQLTRTDDGTIRIGATRVSLDSIVHHFKLGATAEEIAQKFPALKLSEVYAAISYFLENRREVENYLRDQERDADEIQRQIEASPAYRAKVNDLHEQLTARWEQYKKTI